jgi:hypothetical protein
MVSNRVQIFFVFFLLSSIGIILSFVCAGEKRTDEWLHTHDHYEKERKENNDIISDKSP